MDSFTSDTMLKICISLLDSVDFTIYVYYYKYIFTVLDMCALSRVLLASEVYEYRDLPARLLQESHWLS